MLSPGDLDLIGKVMLSYLEKCRAERKRGMAMMKKSPGAIDYVAEWDLECLKVEDLLMRTSLIYVTKESDAPDSQKFQPR